jgi:hypothetical protein
MGRSRADPYYVMGAKRVPLLMKAYLTLPPQHDHDVLVLVHLKRRIAASLHFEVAHLEFSSRIAREHAASYAHPSPWLVFVALSLYSFPGPVFETLDHSNTTMALRMSPRFMDS